MKPKEYDEKLEKKLAQKVFKLIENKENLRIIKKNYIEYINYTLEVKIKNDKLFSKVCDEYFKYLEKTREMRIG